jgi:hypothetical protein
MFSASVFVSLVDGQGEGYRIKASVLQEILPLTPKLRILLTRYALVQGNAGCPNRRMQSVARP